MGVCALTLKHFKSFIFLNVSDVSQRVSVPKSETAGRKERWAWASGVNIVPVLTVTWAAKAPAAPCESQGEFTNNQDVSYRRRAWSKAQLWSIQCWDLLGSAVRRKTVRCSNFRKLTPCHANGQTSERLPDFTDAMRLARSYFSPFDQRLFSLLCQSWAVWSQRRLHTSTTAFRVQMSSLDPVTSTAHSCGVSDFWQYLCRKS